MNCSRHGSASWFIAASLLVTGIFQASATGGTINFANNSSSQVINGQTSNPVSSNEVIYAGLYWSPLGSNNFFQLGSAVPIGEPLAGLFAGGTRTTGAETPGRGSAQFQ